MTLLNLFTILNTQSNITPLASFNYNIRPNFLPQSSPLPLTYVVMYLNPMIRSIFFNHSKCVLFKGKKLYFFHWLVFMILQHPGIDFSKANLKQRSMTKSFFVLTCRLGLSTTKKVSGTPNDSPK